MKFLNFFQKELEDRTQDLDTAGLRHNTPENLILHSTYRYGDVESLAKFHKSRGWAGVGYHLYVSSDGKQYQCRPFDLEGAHAIGFNTSSIGLCFYNNPQDQPNEKIITSVKKLITKVRRRFPEIKLVSHTEAQIEYFNEILKKNGIDQEVTITPNLCNAREFELARTRMNAILASTHIYSSEINSCFKKFKNCPGGIFTYLI